MPAEMFADPKADPDAESDAATDAEQSESKFEESKVIVRSNGTVTYVGKDIAYQMWKFGLLGKDFAYRRFDWSPHEELYPLWSTHDGDDAATHGFSRGD